MGLGCFYTETYWYPNLSEVADHVGGQLRGDKECPFNGVTKSGRVWRQVPESGVRSHTHTHTHTHTHISHPTPRANVSMYHSCRTSKRSALTAAVVPLAKVIIVAQQSRSE